MKGQNNILTIAGFDPTGGAGVLADIKTFHCHGLQGMAVQTANTIQTEDEFMDVNWLPVDVILKQTKTLLGKYPFEAVKIGLIPSLDLLNRILDLFDTFEVNQPVIWDPVLSASSGFDFKQDLKGWEETLKRISWITPNWEECKRITGNSDAMEGALSLSKFTGVYLKGGHNEQNKGKDFLIQNGTVNPLNPKPGDYSEKHGSGCVFSAAFTSNLAKGYPLTKGALRAKRYVEHFLKSNKSLLGYH